MGTTYSKPQYGNYANNRNSVEIGDLFVSMDSIQQKCEISPRQNHGSTENMDTDVRRTRNRYVTMGENSLETDGMPYPCETLDLNNCTTQLKQSKRKPKSTKRNSSKENTNKENINVADTSTLMALKTRIERDITEKVSNATPKVKKPQSRPCSKTSNGGHDEVDCDTRTGNLHHESNRETGELRPHVKKEDNSAIAHGCKIKPCDVTTSSTNNIAAKKNNRSNDLDKQEVVKPQKNTNADSAKTSRTLTNTAEARPAREEMKKEILRFNTFKSFPKDDNKPYITRLAQAGFFYTQKQDEVACFVCGAKKGGWCAKSDPFKEHVALNPNCDFLRKNSDVNIPLLTSSEIESRLLKAFNDSAANSNGASSNVHEAKRQKTEAPTNTTSCTDTDTRNSTQASNDISSSNQHTGSYSNSANLTEQSSRNNSSCSNNNSYSNNVSSTNAYRTTNNGTGQQAMQGSSIDSHTSVHQVQDTRTVLKHALNSDNVTARRRPAPKYQNYVLLSARVASFRECTITIAVDIERLAECGLFYIGYGDCTRCFMCGIGLRHWSSTDDPWVEHARWSMNCAFVLEKKGQQFIDTVKQALEYRRQIDQEATADILFTPRENIQPNNQPTQDSIVNSLLHQTPAQSVLEMGYDSNMVRTAIREIVQGQGREAVTGGNLMEKVFAIEARTEQSKALAKAKTQTTNSATALRNDSNNTTTTTSTPDTKEQRIKLKSENKMLQNQSICTQCHLNEVSIVYLPCGHLITCDSCAPSIKYCQLANCGKYIKGTVRTYRS